MNIAAKLVLHLGSAVVRFHLAAQNTTGKGHDMNQVQEASTVKAWFRMRAWVVSNII